jgi:hypothetical protein
MDEAGRGSIIRKILRSVNQLTWKAVLLRAMIGSGILDLLCLKLQKFNGQLSHRRASGFVATKVRYSTAMRVLVLKMYQTLETISLFIHWLVLPRSYIWVQILVCTSTRLTDRTQRFLGWLPASLPRSSTRFPSIRSVMCCGRSEQRILSGLMVLSGCVLSILTIQLLAHEFR